jgi:hypothetical protein
MANSPLPLAGGVGGELVRLTDHLAFPDMPSPDPSHEWEGKV